MNLRSLIAKAPDFKGKNILVIGPPASGKSFVTALLSQSLIDHRVINTDDYMVHGFQQSLYELLYFLELLKNPVLTVQTPNIIEGMLGYRLLRKGVELDCYYPDIVIELSVSNDTIEHIYNTMRDPAKLKGVMSQIKACNTVYAKYREMENNHKPEWIVIENDVREESETVSDEDNQWMNQFINQ